jgi:O-antigen/teichoic acid export membrane protein
MVSSALIFSSFLRAKEKYGLAIFFSRNIFLIFFIILLIIYTLNLISITNVILGYLLSAILANCLVVYYFIKNIKNGDKTIPTSIIKNGLYYFGIGVALLILLQTGNLIIGKMLSFKDLAVFAVIASVMRLFEFIQDAAYYVLAPHLNKSTNKSLGKIFLKLLLTGLLVSLFYIVFAKPLIHFLFRGLYDEGLYLVPYFIGIGFIRTLFTLPASIIGGRSSTQALKNQFYITALAALLNLGLSVTLINFWQLRGVAMANLISWIFLLIVSFLSTQKYLFPNSMEEKNTF